MMQSLPPNKRLRYPLWSAKAIMLISGWVIAIIAALVFLLSPGSVFVELQITLLLISLCLFAFFTIGLYKGVRLEKPPKEQLPPPADLSALGELLSHGEIPPVIDLPHLPVDAPPLPHLHVDLPGVPDVGDDLIGCLVTLVLWVVVSIVLVFLFWLLAQFLVTVLPALALGLYWVFYRALRIVFAKSRMCKGRLLPSMGYGLVYTVLYTGWIFAVMWIGRYGIVR